MKIGKIITSVVSAIILWVVYYLTLPTFSLAYRGGFIYFAFCVIVIVANISIWASDAEKERIIWNTKNNGVISIIVGDEKKQYTSQLILPIISDGDLIGSIILISEEIGRVITEEDSKIGKIATSLLIKQME